MKHLTRKFLATLQALHGVCQRHGFEGNHKRLDAPDPSQVRDFVLISQRSKVISPPKFSNSDTIVSLLDSGDEVVYGIPPPNGIAPPDSGRRGPEADPIHCRVKVHDTSFFARIAKDTDIGLGESYMFGDYDPDDLTRFIGVCTQNIAAMNAAQSDLGIANWIGTKLQTMAHFARANTIEGSRKNINEHYDLGNDMYKLFLDETWMYSSGVFNSPTDTLYQSQINKVAYSDRSWNMLCSAPLIVRQFCVLHLSSDSAMRNFVLCNACDTMTLRHPRHPQYPQHPQYPKPFIMHNHRSYISNPFLCSSTSSSRSAR